MRTNFLKRWWLMFYVVLTFGIDTALATPIIESVTSNHDSANLYISTSFAPGTLDPYNFLLNIYIDADQNVSTGSLGIVPGSEYSVSVKRTGDVWNTYVTFIGPTTYLSTPILFGSPMWSDPHIGGLIGILSSLSVTADQVSLLVPLSLLGNDDGDVNLNASASVAYSVPTYPFDTSVGSPLILIPFNPIPEPETIPLTLLGLSLFFLTSRRRPI